MACHLAGVPVAVATCGTAFGADHVQLLRRMLLDSDAFTGEVVFTFDGDAAGMKAAERAFGDDQKFMTQTFVAIEPDGLDPCELRQRSGDAAVRDLVAGRLPLVEFVLRTTVGRLDLDTAEGRAAALDRGVPLVASIKDFGLRDEYARRLAGLVGVEDPLRVVSRVRGLVRTGKDEPAAEPARKPVDEAVAGVEREVLKVALQLPSVAGPQFAALPDAAFLVPAHASVRRAIDTAGGATGRVSGPAWLDAVAGALPGEARSFVTALAVEPLHAGAQEQERYAAAILARMQRDRPLPSGGRPEGPAAADQPAGEAGGARPAVRGAHRSRGAAAAAARARDRRLSVALFRRGPRRPRPPADVRARLDAGERIISWAPTPQGPLVATTLGLWWPTADGAGARRIGWEAVSYATWREGVLALTEADVVDDLLIVDRQPVLLRPEPAYDLPATVQRRVTASVARSELQPLPGGAARFVARRVPGRDGLTWWARLEPGTPDTAVVRDAVRRADRRPGGHRRGLSVRAPAGDRSAGSLRPRPSPCWSTRPPGPAARRRWTARSGCR